MIYGASHERRHPYGQCPVCRYAGPPRRVPGLHELNARGVSAAGPALRGRIPSPYGGVASRWDTPDRPPVERVEALPIATPADRLFFLLTSLKTYTLQVVHGRLFGMRQSKAHQGIHGLLPVLLAALRSLGDAPARSLTALAQR